MKTIRTKSWTHFGAGTQVQTAIIYDWSWHAWMRVLRMGARLAVVSEPLALSLITMAARQVEKREKAIDLRPFR